jgi:hypothetical protein
MLSGPRGKQQEKPLNKEVYIPNIKKFGDFKNC